MKNLEKMTTSAAVIALILSPFIVLLGGLLSGVILGLPCMWIWNSLIASTGLALPLFTYKQWILIVALARILIPTSSLTSKN